MHPRVLITGAAKRLGRAIAWAFAEAGYAVVVHCHRSVHEAAELCDRLTALNGLPHRYLSVDLTEACGAETLLEEVVADGQGLSVVVNNASVYRRGGLESLDAASIQQDFAINFLVPLRIMKAYHQLASEGQIINLLDYRVVQADPASGAYGLAKKALKEATLAAALEWAPAFRVNGIAPGLVLPPPGVPAERMKPLVERIPTGRRTLPEQVGRAAVWLTEMDCMNGQILYLDGGLHLLGAEAAGERHGHRLYHE